jgi:hypothetical protein
MMLDRSPSAAAVRASGRRARQRAGVARDLRIRIPTRRLVAAMRSGRVPGLGHRSHEFAVPYGKPWLTDGRRHDVVRYMHLTNIPNRDRSQRNRVPTVMRDESQSVSQLA